MPTYAAYGRITPTALMAAFSGASGKGNWSQLTASTAFAAAGLYVFAYNNSLCSLLFDIGTGPSGSETILIPDLLISTRNGYTLIGQYFPVAIPASSRLVIRCWASNGTSGAVACGVTIVDTAFRGGASLNSCIAIGLDGSAPKGTVVDPGATANTKGAWTELTGSLSQTINAWALAIGNNQNTNMAMANFLFDVGVGPSGSETVILENAQIMGTSSETRMPCMIGPFYETINAGSRIVVRAQSDITDATDRLSDVVFYGFY